MDTRSLGRTGLRFSEITLGTWGLAEHTYGKIGDDRFDETLRAAIDRGITSFDCAPIWGDGQSERRVGRAIAEAKIDAVVTTRAGARRIDGKLVRSFATKDLIGDCEGSLERLGREQVDLLLLHNPGDDVLRREEWREAIEKLESAGKIGAWGVSAGDVEEAGLAIEAGAQAICITHNLILWKDLDDLVGELTKAGCGVLVRSPLHYGMLAGQWAEDRRFASDDHRGHRWSQLAFSERIRQVNQLRFLVGAQHHDLATAALRFVLTHSAVTSAIVGARTPYQASAAAEAASGPPYISDDDMMRLVKVRDQLGI